jgi:hypothetical protein
VRKLNPSSLPSLTRLIQGTQAALRILGLHDVYHMQSLMENTENARLWMKAMNAKYHGKGEMTREDWDELLGNCQVFIHVCINLSPQIPIDQHIF